MKVTQEELVHQIHIANHWVIRFHVARELARYFHSVCSVGGGPIDIDQEIKSQSKRLIKQYDKGKHLTELLDEWKKGVPYDKKR